MAFNAIPFDDPPSIDQACAVPFRTSVQQIEFCLITSSTGRWKFPKGYVEPGETFVEAALKEAFEEAGLHGHVVGDPIGYYEIEKKGCPRNVIAFLMEVVRIDDVWKEAKIRKRRWATAEEARDLVSEPELFELLELAHALARAA